ncbi:MAG TPA: short chain dehydrogenase [Chitinophagaceae bacterium]|nr:short chain dehydrogenase [Chitinophagaceae bacterium]
MKILLIGGAGTIGKAVHSKLQEKHEVIVAGRNSGDIQFNLEEEASIKNLFDKAGAVDAVICIAGEAKWDKFENMKEEDFYKGIRSKLMGQVNIVRIGKDYIKKGGTITLTSGVLADEPEYMTTSAAMVNGALHSFVKAVSLELDDVRVNIVCADLVEDAYERYKDYFPGATPVSMNKVANAYIRSVESKMRGDIIKVKA